MVYVCVGVCVDRITIAACVYFGDESLMAKVILPHCKWNKNVILFVYFAKVW